MLRSLYSGISGMRGFQTKLDVIGNNIANVNTTGFKASRILFQDILSQKTSGITATEVGVKGGINSKQIGLGVTAASIDTIHTPGSAQTTNVPTDLRIDGDGFFAVSANAAPGTTGDFYLTRAGNFTVDGQKQLVNAEGFFVLDNAGAQVVVPANWVAFSIAQDGQLLGVDETGATVAGQKLGVVKVANPAGLEKLGGNLYRGTLNSDPTNATIVDPNVKAIGTGAIISGQLEMSNVDLTAEFSEMIIAQRGFQANSRIITTSDEILSEIVNLKH